MKSQVFGYANSPLITICKYTVYISYTSKINFKKTSSLSSLSKNSSPHPPSPRVQLAGFPVPVSYAGKFGIFEFIQGHRKHLFAHRGICTSITPGRNGRDFFGFHGETTTVELSVFQSLNLKNDRAVSFVLLAYWESCLMAQYIIKNSS